MKIRVLTILFLAFLSCKNATEKETEQIQIVTDSTEFKTAEKQIEKIKPELEFQKISETIKTNFGIENPKLKEVFKPWKTEYYKLIDSTKVKSFKHYSEFLIIEFENQTDSDIEFKKIKTIAEKSLKDKKELFDYYGIFSKGGISFNKVDKWIIAHLLRCNMYPKDYDIDKKFTSELEKFDSETDWIRSYCGWGKMEIK
ncbi:hypothetical protein [Winogradskyella marincola]|uniref:Lipoprotein n=1 Tax=Winogradskyella marincola TaxID=3037795 RepID=A0ABT6FZV1_9FLAO|nr:hypothetical protein [Winogradskyella sp. YYF002]MDG4715327.1 hypothetical protein [Winogradskyella sp. YYF002]